MIALRWNKIALHLMEKILLQLKESSIQYLNIFFSFTENLTTDVCKIISPFQNYCLEEHPE